VLVANKKLNKKIAKALYEVCLDNYKE
jgi:hypothetical protein